MKIKAGEFLGTMGQLERLQRRARATILWRPSFRGNKTQTLFVDTSGAIYGANPESGRMTLLIGNCIPKGEHE